MAESNWTLETLKEYIQQRFADNDKALQAALVAQEKAVAAALAAAKEAVVKAETAADKRFEAANEVKSTFSGELNRKLDRTEYTVQHHALEDKVDVLTERMNQDKGGELSMGKIYAALGAVATVLGIIVLMANHVIGRK